MLLRLKIPQAFIHHEDHEGRQVFFKLHRPFSGKKSNYFRLKPAFGLKGYHKGQGK